MSRWNGGTLRSMREAAKLSRRELMFKIKDKQPRAPAERTIERWEKGETSPNADDLDVLAAVFGCTVEDLFDLDKEAV